MSINLSKGGSINLTKEDPSLEEMIVALGWDANAYDTGFDFDLDASAFCCGANGKCTSDSDFVFYSNETHPSGAVIYSGDNKTGSGEGDDETIIVDLTKIPSNIEKIAFTVTIYDAVNRKQNFGMVSNAYIRLINKKTGVEVAKYNLTEDFSFETAIVFSELYKYDGSWKFKAVGSGFNDGLAGLARNYGLDATGG